VVFWLAYVVYVLKLTALGDEEKMRENVKYDGVTGMVKLV